LNEFISREKEKVLPKKKFTFARKQPTSGATKPKPSQRTAERNAKYSRNDLSIKDIIGMEIKKTEQEYAGKENVINEN
jgi:hypothetical protein